MRIFKGVFVLLLSVILLSLMFVFKLPVYAIDYTNTPGIKLIGQPNFDTNLGAQKGLFYPASISYINNKLFVAEKGGSRVVVYDSIPTANQPTISYVVGQQNPNLLSINFLDPTAKRITQTWSVTSDGTRLIVSDSGNHRILIYNSIPNTNDVAADVVLGQPNFTSNTANNGGLSASSIRSYTGTDANASVGEVYTDGVKLYFTDTSNNRVLIWNTIPTTNNAPADVVVGQPDFTSNAANNGGISASTLYSPRGVKVIDGKLFISDYGNSRILIWNSVPTTNGVPADVVLGQPNMTSNTANNGGISATSLYYPMYVNSNGGKLYIADTVNNRIKIYNTIPTTNNAPADIVLGQPNMTSSTPNNGGVSATSLLNPSDVKVINDKLFIADYGNSRIKIYNTVPTTNNAPADIVIGQPNMLMNSITNAGSMNLNRPVARVSSGRFLVVERLYHRVSIWNDIPTDNEYPVNPDILVGQANMSDFMPNMGTGVAANTLHTPESAVICNEKLIVSDYGNSRILIWNTIPTTNGTAADVVIGQPNMTSNTANNGGRSASTLNAPVDVYCFDNKLFVADTYNNRVLIWNNIPTVNNVSADIVLGQPNFTSSTANNGGISNKSLSRPFGVFVSTTGHMIVADYNNHRVLIWNSIPTTNFAEADVVIGQPDFVSNTTNNGGISATSLNWPQRVFADGIRLFIADTSNHRILGYNSIPTTNGALADFILGQASFERIVSSLSSVSLVQPTMVSTYNGYVYVSDSSNNRVIMYPFGPQNVGVSAPSKTTSRNITVQLSATGAKEMLVSTKSDFSDAVWEPYSSSKSMVVPSGDGLKKIYVKYRDYANYEGSVLSANTTLDSTGPLGEISVVSPNNNGYVNDRNVVLLINGSDALSGVSQMMISSNSNFTSSVWESYSTSKNWILSEGDGTKMIYIKFKDNSGNVSKVYNTSVILDTTTEADIESINNEVYVEDKVYKVQPIPTIIGTGESGSTVLIKWEDKKLGETTVKNDGTWIWTPETELGNGLYVLSIEHTDQAGNRVVKGLSIEVSGNSTNTGNDDIDYPPVVETPDTTEDKVDTDSNILIPVLITVGSLLLLLILFFIYKRRREEEN